MPLSTTAGQVLINEALPTDLRDYTRELNKKGIANLLSEVADKHPDQYRAVLKSLMDIGRENATLTGGHSFDISHIRPAETLQKSREELRHEIRAIMSDREMPTEERDKQLAVAIGRANNAMQQRVFDEAKKAGNPLAKQIMSGARGNVPQLNILIGGQMVHRDHKDRDIPYPIMHAFAEGLTPAEWYATTYGARKGLIGTKLGTGKSGYFAKQLNQLTHRLMVIAEEEDAKDDGVLRGLPVEADDPDNVGALLAAPVGGYDRNTVITPSIASDLQRQGIKRMLVRSPTVGGPGDGIYAKDVGIREGGRLPNLGDLVGMTAAQAVSERVTQGSLGAKHRGGEGAQISGFGWIQSQVAMPRHMAGRAAHAELDGTVTRIEDTGTGGKRIWINETPHFAEHGLAPKVKVGDTIEAGDVLSDGVPSPQKVVQHKGIGEGRRYFLQSFGEALRGAGAATTRRNLELVARGAIDHVELEESSGEMLPGDILSYQQLERNWQPRAGMQQLAAKKAVGKYLERPVLHYTVGTKIRPRMLQDFKDFGVNNVDVHDDPPPFKPVMLRSMDILQHDPDVMTRFYGSGHKKSLTTAVHRGQQSDTRSTSFVPSLAEGISFGDSWPNAILKKT